MWNSRAEEVSQGFREWLAAIIKELGIKANRVAKQSKVSGSWLSQLMNGRRKHCDQVLMDSLKKGLIALVVNNPKVEQQKLLQSVEIEFSPYVEMDEAGADYSAEAMRVAADVLTTIIQKCPSRLMRRRVVEFLKVAVEQ